MASSRAPSFNTTAARDRTFAVCGEWPPNTGILTPSRGTWGLVAEHQPPVLFKDTHSGQIPVLYRTDPPTLLLAWTQWNFPHFLQRKRRTRLAVVLGLRTTPFLHPLAHTCTCQKSPRQSPFRVLVKNLSYLALKKCSSLFQTKAKTSLGLEWGCHTGDHLHLLLLCACYNIMYIYMPENHSTWDAVPVVLYLLLLSCHKIHATLYSLQQFWAQLTLWYYQALQPLLSQSVWMHF